MLLMSMSTMRKLSIAEDSFSSDLKNPCRAHSPEGVQKRGESRGRLGFQRLDQSSRVSSSLGGAGGCTLFLPGATRPCGRRRMMRSIIIAR